MGSPVLSFILVITCWSFAAKNCRTRVCFNRKFLWTSSYHRISVDRAGLGGVYVSYGCVEELLNQRIQVRNCCIATIAAHNPLSIMKTRLCYISQRAHNNGTPDA